MDLNIYEERKKPFELVRFQEQISLFMVRNQVRSAHTSSFFKDALSMLNVIVQEQIINNKNIDLDKDLEIVFKEFDKFEKAEIYENLQNNEQGIFSCLLKFTKQYIQAIKENKYYYNDNIIHYENILIKADPQEMFDFSKQYFALAIKNKKISFDKIIEKEIQNFENKYGFKDIFFRKTLNLRDKIILLKNFETLNKALEDIANDLNLEYKSLSLNGLITISFEPTILGYSSATAYMNRLNNDYVISLGKYEHIKELKQSYIHEFAHCLDYSNYNNGDKKITYSEVALKTIKDNSAETAIEKIMQKEIGFENYQIEFKIKYKNMQQEIFNVIKEEFEVQGEIDLKEFHKTDVSDLIINNYYNLDTYKLMHVLVFQALMDKDDYIQAMNVKHNKMPEEKNSEKFKKIEEKIQLIRDKHNYILTNNCSFFLNENKSALLKTDKEDKKQYYTKPLEIFARAFETYYRTEKAIHYTFLEESEKLNYKFLLKEAIDSMLPQNNISLKKVMK